jgi:GAF domain-containing protein
MATDGEYPSTAVSFEELRVEVARLRLLNSISHEFNSSLDFDELLPKVFDTVLDALHAQGGSIWIAEGDVLRCRLAAGAASQKLVGTERPLGEGFVGDVARKQRTTIVSDPMADPRFQQRFDRSSTMLTTSLMATAMVTRGVTVGAIQVTNKTGDDGIFDDQDRELLEGLAGAAAIALRNAQLHSAEKRARDLALLLEISREITSTLDLDRVLDSVVNLATRALPFDRGAVALWERHRCEVRSIAGQETVDTKSAAVKRLATRGAWAVERGATFYLADREAPHDDADQAFVTAFAGDLEQDGVRSALYVPLKDEEGTLGVLLFEAAGRDFASETQRELAEILGHQTTVAVRNAELYNQVPLADALGTLAARKRALMQVPRRRIAVYAGVAALVLAALTLIGWPLRVVGTEPVFRAWGYVDTRALTPGVIQRVMVQEGDVVAAGTPLAQLRDAELRAQRAATAAALAGAGRVAATAASRGDPATERLQRAREVALREELAVLDEHLAAQVIRAPVTGTVLTPRTGDLVGLGLEAGDPVIRVGRTDTLELEFGVRQRDLSRVGTAQTVRLRVDAVPERTFRGTVVSVAQLPVTFDGEVVYPVRALIPNADDVLKPGMLAHARVLTAPASVATRVLRQPVRWLRLAWWRLAR